MSGSFLNSLLQLQWNELIDYLSAKSYEDLVMVKKEIEIGYAELEKRKNLILTGMDLEKIEDNVDNNFVVNNIYILLKRLEDVATVVERMKFDKRID